MARAAFNGVNLGAGHQFQHLPGFRTDILHPLMAGHMPGDLANRVLEFGVQQSRLVPVRHNARVTIDEIELTDGFNS